ncbi:hypothetical protein TNCV_3693231 [Trichonephila clavipes]|nr:hypothetical protein TNCV_3693231 [Trichonephila clavipes]
MPIFKITPPLISVPKATISSLVPPLPFLNPLHQLRHNSYHPHLLLQLHHQNLNHLIPLIDTAPTSSTSAASSSSTISIFTPLPAHTCPVFQNTTTTSNIIPFTSPDAKQTSKPCKKNALLKTQVTL